MALAPLFEGAPRFLARLCAERPFGDEAGLLAAARAVARGMSEPDQLELIDAHPRLGAPRESVSPLSFVEQGYARDVVGAEAGAGANAEAPLGAAEGREAAATAQPQRAKVAAELERLNRAYEARFGFRYCVFVAGRPRAALLPGFRAALDADRDAEIARALDAVVDIAADRYRGAAHDAFEPGEKLEGDDDQAAPAG